MAQQTEFIPYEQALELKELGFNEPCFGYWNIDPYLPKPTFNLVKPFDHEWCIPAPLYQQAFRWFREKNGLHSIYTMGDDWNNFYWQVWKNDCMTKTYVCSSDYVFETYEEAELAAIVKLIEIVKQK